MKNEQKLIEALKQEFPDKKQNQHEEITWDYFLELCSTYKVKPTDALADKILSEVNIAVDFDQEKYEAAKKSTTVEHLHDVLDSIEELDPKASNDGLSQLNNMICDRIEKLESSRKKDSTAITIKNLNDILDWIEEIDPRADNDGLSALNNIICDKKDEICSLRQKTK